MPVALRRRRRGRLAQHTTRTRRHDDRCVRVTLGDFMVDTVPIDASLRANRRRAEAVLGWKRQSAAGHLDRKNVVVLEQWMRDAAQTPSGEFVLSRQRRSASLWPTCF